MSDDRQYELILFGATGYTGKLTAEYIQEHVATDLKWAIAGRNRNKLEAVVDELIKLNGDRAPPAIEISELKRGENDLDGLAKKAQVIITTVGPYHKYGTPVLEACVAQKTHYLDITGEVPWTYDMLNKHHAQAKQDGTMILPQCGIDSVPSDVLAYLLASKVREQLNCGITTCICTLQDMKNGFSGGTLSSFITLSESYSIPHLIKSISPFSLSAIAPPKGLKSTDTYAGMLIGAREVEGLGILSDSPQASSDIPIVNRSWSLFDSGNFYGQKFNFSEYMRVSGYMMGSLVHYGLAAFTASLLLPGMKWLVSRMVLQPGEGPDKKHHDKSYCKYKAIATPEADANKKAIAKIEYKGNMYYATGVLVVEAALTMLRGGDFLGKRLAGMITPATLEMGYVDRLKKAGFDIDVEVQDRSSRL